MRVFHHLLAVTSIVPMVLTGAAVALPRLAQAGEAMPVKLEVSVRKEKLRIYAGSELVSENRISATDLGYSKRRVVRNHSPAYQYGYGGGYDCEGYGYSQAYGYEMSYGHYGNPYVEEITVALPADFTIAARDMRLASFSHPALPDPNARDEQAGDPQVDQWRRQFERSGMVGNESHSIVTGSLSANDEPAPTEGPLRILIASRSRADMVSDIQRLLNQLGHGAGPVDGRMGKSTAAGIRSFQKSQGLLDNGELNAGIATAIYRAAGEQEPKAARLVAAKGDKIIADEGIDLRNGRPLTGINVLIYRDTGETGGWQLVSLTGRHKEAASILFRLDGQTAAQSAAGAFDILVIPHALRATLSRHLGEGSTLVITEESYSEISPAQS
ncbi:MAG: peptidoglycan-binding domain-containing protein [Rhizobiaceae bacterium]